MYGFFFVVARLLFSPTVIISHVTVVEFLYYLVGDAGQLPFTHTHTHPYSSTKRMTMKRKRTHVIVYRFVVYHKCFTNRYVNEDSCGCSLLFHIISFEYLTLKIRQNFASTWLISNPIFFIYNEREEQTKQQNFSICQ